ncbi:MAG: hypothetical protein K2G03_07380 [Bacilli bacterium]|nr:hypothetical protein [Bacilli bacterium]
MKLKAKDGKYRMTDVVDIEVTYIHLRKVKYRIVHDIINQNTSEKKLYAYVEFKTK